MNFWLFRTAVFSRSQPTDALLVPVVTIAIPPASAAAPTSARALFLRLSVLFRVMCDSMSFRETSRAQFVSATVTEWLGRSLSSEGTQDWLEAALRLP